MCEHRSVGTPLSEQGSPSEAKQTRYLVLDSRVIDETREAKLTLGEISKHPQNPLFKEDRSWEPRFDNVYPDAIYDEEDKLYKCWYNPMIIEEQTTSIPEDERNPYDHPDYAAIKPHCREIALCYAVSTDGIQWEKPELGLVEFGGDKRNNILTRRRGVAGVFKDARETNLAQRYKMFFAGGKGTTVAFSADGLHWGEPMPVPNHEGGNRPSAFWAPHLGKYVAITRRWSDTGTRQVTQTESSDFVHWRKERTALEGPKSCQTHDMVAFPTCGLYIGLVGLMVFPDDSNRRVTQHAELAWSPDTVTWHRIQEGTPFIGHSPGGTARYGEMPYDWGTIFASAPIFLDDEIRIYYGASDWYFFDWRRSYLALATLRPDGWAGYEPISAETPAVITTQPLAFDGQVVGITADVQNGGSIRVAILDAGGTQLATSTPVSDTVTEGQVRWEGDSDLVSLRGQRIRLRFQLRNAKLYGFQIT